MTWTGRSASTTPSSSRERVLLQSLVTRRGCRGRSAGIDARQKYFCRGSTIGPTVSVLPSMNFQPSITTTPLCRGYLLTLRVRKSLSGSPVATPLTTPPFEGRPYLGNSPIYRHRQGYRHVSTPTCRRCACYVAPFVIREASWQRGPSRPRRRTSRKRRTRSRLVDRSSCVDWAAKVAALTSRRRWRCCWWSTSLMLRGSSWFLIPRIEIVYGLISYQTPDA